MIVSRTESQLSDEEELLQSLARKILNIYSRRSNGLKDNIFSAPAWEILLHLKVAGKPMVLAELAVLLQTAEPVCQRWLAVLVERKLVTCMTGSPRASYEIAPEGRRLLSNSLRSSRLDGCD